MNKAILDLYERVAAVHHATELYSWNIDASELSAGIQEVVEKITTDAAGVYQAESPWEAAIFLVDLQARAGFVALDGPLDFGTFVPAQNYKKIFRGQKAHYDNIQPSAWRESTWIREGVPVERGESWLASFCLLLKLVTEADAGLSLQGWLYHAVAQHYQIPTDLLDWTVDPFIAVWFAHWGAIKKDDRGKVYCVELENELKSAIVLPPPFAQRLFRQRGLFNYTTQANQADNEALYDGSIKIEFPLAMSWSLPKSYPYHHDNQLITPSRFIFDVRERAKQIALAVEPGYFGFTEIGDDDIKKAAIEEAKQGALKADLESLIHLYGHSFTRAKWEVLLRQWVVEVNNYVSWLCMMDSSQGQHMTVPGSMLALEKINRDSMFLYARKIIDMGEGGTSPERVQAAHQSIERLTERYPELNEWTQDGTG